MMPGKRASLWCSHCRQAPPFARGLCRGCYTRWRNHGDLPDLDVLTPADRPTGTCSDCKDLVYGRSKYCHPCAEYRRTHDNCKRPRHLWDPTATCKTCGKPLTGDSDPHVGYCHNCYQYQLDRGKSRPKRLWGVDGLGWCDCGQPAVAVVALPRLELRPHAGTGRLNLLKNADQTITFNLCADCLALEEEMAA